MTLPSTVSQATATAPRLPGLAALLLVGSLAGLLTACVDDEPTDDPGSTVEDPVEDPTARKTVLGSLAPPGGVEDPEPNTFATLPALCGIAYDDANLQGTQYPLLNNQEQAFNYTRISSLDVGPNCTITLKTAGGSSKKFAGGAGGTFWWFVGSDWNDRASRASCTCTTTPKVAAYIYEDANYGGNYVALWNDTYGSIAGGWNDRVTAIKTNTGSSIELSENSPPSGRAYVSEGGSTANVGSSFNDLASHFVADGTYWNQCGVPRLCYRTSTVCGGLADVSPNLVDCFVARNGNSYCQEAVNGSFCIPRSATPL